MARSGYIIKLVPLRSKPNGEWLVHPDLRKQIVEQAANDGHSMNEAIVKILADKVGVDFAPAQRKTAPAKENVDQFVIHMPIAVHKGLERKTTYPASIQDTIRRLLCEHYGLRLPPKVKHVRRHRRRATT